jgi:cysteine desulfurase
MIYLDNNSTTKPSKSAILGMNSALENFWGNSSSIHEMGGAARAAHRDTASNLAKFLGIGDEASIGFTSGGTEANQRVINYIAEDCSRMAFLETEHSSVIETYSRIRSIESFSLPVRSNGAIDLNNLESRLRRGECKAVSIQWANSETGVIQPINEILNLCQLYGTTLHVDAAQAIGKIALDPDLLENIDFLTFTAHKMHGPQGVGVIVTGNKQQEFNIIFPNTHTQNSPGIIAFGKVIEERLSTNTNYATHLLALRDSFEEMLLSLHPNLKVNGAKCPRIPNTSNVQFTGIDGAALVARLDREGIMCSQVSACLTGRPEPSYVLTAMGISEEVARSSIRFSFSINNTPAEVTTAVNIISACYLQLLNQSQLLLS